MHERVWPQLSKNNQVSILRLLASCMMCYPYLFSNWLQTNKIIQILSCQFKDSFLINRNILGIGDD
jgi:hypothetical protein